jgi:hypothetical protein
MLTGQLSDDEGSELISTTVAELDELIKQTPGARETAIRILDVRLANPLKATAWDDLLESLGAFLGRGPTSLLGWVSFGDWEERSSKVSAPASPEALRFIRELVGIFGNDIRQAMTAREQLPDDWIGLRLRVMENRLLGGDYRISVEIDKVRGESISMEAPPDSILNLVRHLIRALTAVGNSAVFSQDLIDGFREQVGELEKLLATDQPSETAEGIEAGADVVATAET